MSNTLAIATMTGVLEARVRTLVNTHLAGFDVFIDHPRGDSPAPGVYIKPYRIAPSAALRNMDLPTRRSDGTAARQPRLAIEVDLMMCFVGDGATLDAERLAGLVLTDLHARPVLSTQEIGDFLSGLPGGHVLLGADLGDQLERVKITPLALSLEDLARVWGLTNQTQYPLTVAYQVSVILLDADVRTRAALPVTGRSVYVTPTMQPRLAEVRSSARRQPVVAMGEDLILYGQDLRGPSTWLRIGNATFELQASAFGAASITIPLAPGLGVQAGITAVQVVHRVQAGPATDPWRNAGESNSLPLAVVPVVAPDQPNAVPSGGSFEVRLDVTPTPASDQDVELVLDRIGGGEQVTSREWSLDGDVVVFTIPSTPPGPYLIRLRVDDAVSLPTTDGTGVLAQPAVTIP